MTKFDSVDQAYECIARAALEFPANRLWDAITSKYRLYNKMASAEWAIQHGEVVDEKGKSPPRELRNDSFDAALFLRDDLLKNTGHRIWGLTFTLFPSGKFKIDYDYNKPTDYNESDETVEVDFTRSIQGMK